jgi:hypothetical protein
MPGKLGNLPGRQVGKQALGQRIAFLTEPFDFLADIEFGIVTDEPECVDPGFQLGDRLFKLKELKVHLGANRYIFGTITLMIEH